MGISKKAAEFAGLPVVDFHPAAGLMLPTMPRREFRSDSEESFWAITLEGSRIITQTGKVGGSSKTTAKALKSPEAARVEYAKRLAEKANEDSLWNEQPPSAATMREALISAIKADPDDAASRNAYADFLSEQGEALPAAAYSVQVSDLDGEEITAALEAFLADPAVGLVQALVIGPWGEEFDTGPDEVIEALIAARKRLTGLRALFLGDIVYEECEISWINQADITPLLKAFPDLEHFRSRGGDGLELKKFKHAKLKSLVIEASNLSRDIVKAVGASDLPALEHLEVWLGTDRYGADTEVGDLKGILQAKGLPSLKHLGLRNSEITDGIAAALAKAPVMGRLRSLDLSLGTLTDEGAEALLAIPAVAKLEKLDLHHHYLSAAMVKRVKALGIEVDAGDTQTPHDYGDGETHRYVAHAE